MRIKKVTASNKVSTTEQNIIDVNSDLNSNSIKLQENYDISEGIDYIKNETTNEENNVKLPSTLIYSSHPLTIENLDSIIQAREKRNVEAHNTSKQENNNNTTAQADEVKYLSFNEACNITQTNASVNKVFELNHLTLLLKTTFVEAFDKLSEEVDSFKLKVLDVFDVNQNKGINQKNVSLHISNSNVNLENYIRNIKNEFNKYNKSNRTCMEYEAKFVSSAFSRLDKYLDILKENINAKDYYVQVNEPSNETFTVNIKKDSDTIASKKILKFDVIVSDHVHNITNILKIFDLDFLKIDIYSSIDEQRVNLNQNLTEIQNRALANYESSLNKLNVTQISELNFENEVPSALKSFGIKDSKALENLTSYGFYNKMHNNNSLAFDAIYGINYDNERLVDVLKLNSDNNNTITNTTIQGIDSQANETKGYGFFGVVVGILILAFITLGVSIFRIIRKIKGRNNRKLLLGA